MIDQSLTFQQFTPLNVLVEELCHTIKDRGLLYSPTPITKAPNKRDRNKFCDFHNTYGHTTTQCQDLRNHIEDLVRNRYLDDFIKGSHPVADLRHGLEKNVEDVGHEQPAIRVIVGGPTLAGDLNRSQKSYSRYAMTSMEVMFNVPAMKRAKARQVPIMWTDDDGEGILYPHKDALVISADVTSKKVERILVDAGSSVDVLFKSTRDEVGIT